MECVYMYMTENCLYMCVCMYAYLYVAQAALELAVLPRLAWDLLCNPGCPGTNDPPEYWSNRCVLPHWLF